MDSDMENDVEDKEDVYSNSILLVKAKIDEDYPKKLSNAIVSCYNRNENVSLRCIGGIACNNAVNAIAISRPFLESENSIFVTEITESRVQLKNKNNGNIMMSKVFTFSSSLIDGKAEDTNVNINHLLKVRGFSNSKEENNYYVDKLSNAICSCFLKHDIAFLRYVGKFAGMNAIEALLSARGEMFKGGINLGFVPSFTSVKFDKEEKSGFVL
ncbi:MAG: stage V sporulation protein S, partial [Clostridia bacterium]